MARRFDDGEQQGQNWLPFVLFGICVEFWIVVSTVVAQSI
jgi:hypothetical protein